MDKNNYTSDTNGEDQLINLLLKRQAELNSLLEVTQAINKNISTSVLFEMLEVILNVHLKVGKLRLLIREGQTYYCVTKFGGKFETHSTYQKIAIELTGIKTPSKISDHPDPMISCYDYFVPVHHKNHPLAYVLIGDFNTTEELLNNDLNFIQTLINVITVALENKKLFKERIQRERLQREMELASQVQNMLIPQKLPKNHVMDVAATYLPHQNLGGDYFDFSVLSEEEYLWCIADVSGKGISAAMLMANFQASLRAWVSVEPDLKKIIEKLNEIVLNNTKGERFITLFMAKFNSTTRKLSYVNAGHNPSIMICGDEVKYLEKGTTMIGVFDQLPFVNQEDFIVEPNTLLFNYTDGLIEHDGNENLTLSETSLLEFLQKNHHKDVEDLNRELIKKLEMLKSNRSISDDITLLTLKFH